MAHVSELPAPPEPATAAQCPNCGSALPPGRFCPGCGQPRHHRLTTGHVLHELLHVFTHADKSIFAYAGRVLARPARPVADYLAGRRQRHFNPFQFLLLAVGLTTLLTTSFHFYEQLGAGVQAQMAARGAPAALLARAGTYFQTLGRFVNVWSLGLLPLFALAAWAAYRRRGLNYAESFLVVVVVGSAYQLWLGGVLLGWLAVTGGQLPSFSLAPLQAVVYLVYLTAIGRGALGLGWGGALGRAGLVTLLAAAIGLALNYGLFQLYVLGG